MCQTKSNFAWCAYKAEPCPQKVPPNGLCVTCCMSMTEESVLQAIWQCAPAADVSVPDRFLFLSAQCFEQEQPKSS